AIKSTYELPVGAFDLIRYVWEVADEFVPRTLAGIQQEYFPVPISVLVNCMVVYWSSKEGYVLSFLSGGHYFIIKRDTLQKDLF
uniref:hypothetical protein n=1 Tax=Parabacteroides goldsteinii TaxID=328812 RepID=UPI0025B67F55